MISYLIENKFSITISLDGPEEIHNRFRKYNNGIGSFSDTIKGLRLFENISDNINVSCVLSDVKDIMPTFDFFIDNGIKSIKYCFAFSHKLGRCKENFDKDKLINAATDFIKMARCISNYNSVQHKSRIVVHNIRYLLSNVLGLKKKYMCYSSPCGAGTAMLAVDVNGNVFPCDLAKGLLKSDQLQIKNLKQLNYDPVVLLFQNRVVGNIPKCTRCSWRIFCGGGCPCESFEYTGNFYSPSYWCEFYKTFIEEIIWEINKDPNMVRNLL